METTPKKRGDFTTTLGRPSKGSLSSYPESLVKLIKAMREAHSGWGAQIIQMEIVQTTSYKLKDLPSLSAIHRYLKEQGLVKVTIPTSQPPSGLLSRKIKRVHDLWQMDAQGTLKVDGIGYHSIINIKDIKSKVHCMAFPVSLTSPHAQPKALHYFWALRLAFLEWGLPKAIQVDKDSAFYESTSKSAFPKLLQIWLAGLGIELRFITKPPPTQNATIERAHQTIEKQAIQGQKYTCWKYFFNYCNERRKRINEILPNRSLGKKAPLQVFPKACHSTRVYSLETEEQLIDIKQVQKHLTNYTWYRKVSKSQTINLGGHKYYVKNAQAYTYVQVNFCNRSKKLVFRNDKEQILTKFPIKKIDSLTLMGADSKTLKSMLYKIKHFKTFSL